MELTTLDLIKRLKELAVIQDSIRSEMEDIENRILNGTTGTAQPKYSKMTLTGTTVIYSPTARIEKKTQTVLKLSRKAMSNREVAEEIARMETRENDSAYKKELVKKFSAVVGGRAKTGKMFKRYEQDGILYYGLTDWFSSDGAILPEFKHEE